MISLAESNRPLPWNLMDAQSCVAFQYVTGVKTRSARTAARYGHGVANHRRSRLLVSRYKVIDTSKKTIVYFEIIPSPSAAPAGIQKMPRPVSSASQTSDIA